MMSSKERELPPDYVSPERVEIATVIGWVGLALIAYSLITVGFGAWPIALLQPQWLQKMSNLLLGTSLPLCIGVLLVACTPVVSPADQKASNQANLVRRFASWVAILYLLLIPVQIYSGSRLISSRGEELAQQLTKATKAIDAIQNATNIEEMRNAYNQIPGRKPPLPSQFNIPFPEARDRIADGLRPLAARAETRYKEAIANGWREWTTSLVRVILLCLILFTAFSAIGRKSPHHPTLLRSILSKKQTQPFPGARKKKSLFGGARKKKKASFGVRKRSLFKGSGGRSNPSPSSLSDVVPEEWIPEEE